MITKVHNICNNCRHFKKEPFRECHRYAPKPLILSNNDVAIVNWPIMDCNDFCGEFELKVELVVNPNTSDAAKPITSSAVNQH
jgi:hypothetical protein